jgi:hypothetical protein
MVESSVHPSYEYLGLSTDQKPLDAPDNSLFRELNTGNCFYFSNGQWNHAVGGDDSYSGGGSVEVDELNVTENGQYDAGSGHAYNPVNVDVPQTDIIPLSVTENGTSTAPAGKAYSPVTVNVPNPSSGTIQISQNGTVDVTQYATAEVNVQGGSDEDFKAVIERTAVNPKLPNNLTEIGEYAFYNCSQLALTSLPNSITSIKNYAFYNCSQLALTSLPNSIEEDIGNYAFFGCSRLQLTSLPLGVKQALSQTFRNCTSLTTFLLHSGITALHDRCFMGCTGLTTVTFKGNPFIYSSAFSSCSNLTDIYVPWSQGEVANAPWGATNATIHYDWTGV